MRCSFDAKEIEIKFPRWQLWQQELEVTVWWDLVESVFCRSLELGSRICINMFCRCLFLSRREDVFTFLKAQKIIREHSRVRTSTVRVAVVTSFPAFVLSVQQ